MPWIRTPIGIHLLRQRQAGYRVALSEEWKRWGPAGGCVSALALRVTMTLLSSPRPDRFR